METELMLSLFEHNLNNPNYGHNALWLSRHHLLTIEIVVSHNNVKWNMDAISVNPVITMKDVISYPELNWNWALLTHNPNFNINTYRKFSEKPWDFQRVAMMGNVSIADILGNDRCRDFAFVSDAKDLIFENMNKENFEGFDIF